MELNLHGFQVARKLGSNEDDVHAMAEAWGNALLLRPIPGLRARSRTTRSMWLPGTGEFGLRPKNGRKGGRRHLMRIPDRDTLEKENQPILEMIQRGRQAFSIRRLIRAAHTGFLGGGDLNFLGVLWALAPARKSPWGYPERHRGANQPENPHSVARRSMPTN